MTSVLKIYLKNRWRMMERYSKFNRVEQRISIKNSNIFLSPPFTKDPFHAFSLLSFAKKPIFSGLSGKSHI